MLCEKSGFQTVFQRRLNMKQMLMIFVAAMAFVFTANGQNQASMNELLSPSATDFSEAKNQGFEVFRLLPRGMFDYEQNELSIRGGGAYYSFVKKSHSYNDTAQIELQDNDLSVGFAGTNYGMIADLGEIPLSELDSKNKSVNSLYNYQAKSIYAEVRNEQQKLFPNLEINGLKFTREVKAVVGHTYVLRAISYDEADTLVAFKVQNKDDNGSLTIFWKLIKNFEKPILIKDTQKVSEADAAANKKLIEEIHEILRSKGFTDVVASTDGKMIVLRGTIPKGKLAEVIQIAQEISKKPVKNELTVK